MFTIVGLATVILVLFYKLALLFVASKVVALFLAIVAEGTLAIVVIEWALAEVEVGDNNDW